MQKQNNAVIEQQNVDVTARFRTAHRAQRAAVRQHERADAAAQLFGAT